MYSAFVIFFVENPHNKNNPEKNPRGFLNYLSFDLPDLFTAASFELSRQISCDVIQVAFLLFQNKLQPHTSGNMRIVSTWETNVKTNLIHDCEVT